MGRHVVCRVEELPEGARVILPLGGRQGIGVFNIRGRFVAVRNACPHAGAPICEGTLSGTVVASSPFERGWAFEGEILRCPWHAWEFKLPDGVTITEPAVRLKTFPTYVEDGQVVVEVGGGRAPLEAQAS